MKTVSVLSRIFVLTVTLGVASVTTTLAQTEPTPTATAPSATKPTTKLTHDEQVKLSTARQNVLAANPELKAEGDNLKIQAEALKAQGASASPADKAALGTQAKAHEQKMRDAMLALDPTLAPVFAKLDAMHQHK